jgi:hypothetical protein
MKRRAPAHNQYLISVQRPQLWLLALAGVLVVIGFMIWGAFVYGQNRAGHDRVAASDRADELENQIDDLLAQNEELQRQNARLSRDMGIDRDAGGQVEKELTKAQAQILDMKEELTFYRSIVQPNKTARTVHIKKIALEPDGTRQFKYKMSLVQDGRNDSPVRGTVEFYLEGSRGGDHVELLEWSTISVEKVEKQQKFGFKYFQNFEGAIKLPDKFVPSSIHVKVLSATSGVVSVEETYPWDAMLNEENT